MPGRFEPVDAGQPFRVIVDFAHTPDGLARCSSDAGPGGGHRAASSSSSAAAATAIAAKRPLMGEVAAELADVVVVTSDNPADEDPLAIIAAVVAGVPRLAGPRSSSSPTGGRRSRSAWTPPVRATSS